jgi:hypothetical protein
MDNRLKSSQVVLNSLGLHRARWVMDQFAAAGFRIGPAVGISFSIEAPRNVFENFFNIRPEDAGKLLVSSTELPLDALSADLRQHLETVLLTRAPDFGAGSDNF